MVFAHRWHPIGAAVGEPEAESSTPTFHVFGRWDAELVTPGEQLRLPTQRRVPAAADELKEYAGVGRSRPDTRSPAALAAAVQDLMDCPGVTGLSCVVPEPGPGGVEVHAMGRSAGESLNPMQEFLELPKVSQALL